MKISLTDSFKEISSFIWEKYGQSLHLDMQLGEETITDFSLLILLAKRHKNLHIYKFNKTQEILSGADYLIWFIDDSIRNGVGISFQAKRLSYQEQTFVQDQNGIEICTKIRNLSQPHKYNGFIDKKKLKYSDLTNINPIKWPQGIRGKNELVDVRQYEILIAHAQYTGVYPMYTLYNYWEPGLYNLTALQGLTNCTEDYFGCSIISAECLRRMIRRNPTAQGIRNILFSDISRIIKPWHFLLLGNPTPKSPLVDRVVKYINAQLVENEPKFKSQKIPEEIYNLIIQHVDLKKTENSIGKVIETIQSKSTTEFSYKYATPKYLLILQED